MGFLTDDNDFHCFLIVDNDFDRLLMDEIGWSVFSIDEVSFHSFSINHISFPEYTFKETSFHAMHLYEIVSPGDPLNEMILIFLSPLMKAVFIDSTSEEQIFQKFPWMMFTSMDFKSIHLVTIGFFLTETIPAEFYSMKPIFKEILYRNFFQEIPFYTFEFHGIQINQNCFFRYSYLKKYFLRIPVDGVGFNKFSLEEINFRGFSVHEAQFCGFPLNENKFLGFSRMKLISIDSHSTSFMLHGVTKADRFFPWVSEYLKLTSLLF